jgi:hypothetical protein
MTASIALSSSVSLLPPDREIGGRGRPECGEERACNGDGEETTLHDDTSPRYRGSHVVPRDAQPRFPRMLTSWRPTMRRSSAGGKLRGPKRAPRLHGAAFQACASRLWFWIRNGQNSRKRRCPSAAVVRIGEPKVCGGSGLFQVPEKMSRTGRLGEGYQQPGYPKFRIAASTGRSVSGPILLKSLRLRWGYFADSLQSRSWSEDDDG